MTVYLLWVNPKMGELYVPGKWFILSSKDHGGRGTSGGGKKVNPRGRQSHVCLCVIVPTAEIRDATEGTRYS